MSTPHSLDGKTSNALNSDISSYLTHHLRSSFGISTTQVQHIVEVLAQKENGLAKEVRKHQMEVSRHQAALISLENQQKILERYSHACRSLLSPIRRLPVEVLREIFMHFCGENRIFSGHVCFPPLKLAGVCGGWRNLVFSAPQLWTRIYVNTSKLTPKRSKCAEQLVNLALKHSSNSPLHVSLFDNGSRPARDAVSIVKSIARHSHRWRHATLDLPVELIDEMHMFVRALPLLESLIISCSLSFDMINKAPKLRDLELNLEPDDSRLLKLPWDQILSLKINFINGLLFSDILPWLQRCKVLRQLDFGPCYFSDSEVLTGDGDDHTITNIQSLSLSHFNDVDFELVFSRFTLPQLTQLSLAILDGWKFWTDRHARIMEKFLLRSSCTITLLALHGIGISDEHIVSLLKLLPSLEELSIDQSYKYGDDNTPSEKNITDYLITSLRVSPSPSFTNANSHLLPKLHAIELSMDHEHAPSCEALIEFVKSRWLPDPAFVSDLGADCLKSATFHFLFGTVNYDFSALDCLRDTGLKFTVTGVRE